MKTNEIFKLGIIKDDTEIFIRGNDSELLAHGNWYEDHILDYSNKKYTVESFTWQNNKKIHIDIIIDKVEIMLFNNIEKAKYMDREELLNKEVRYVASDYEFSGYDIYEDIYTGEFYATIL